MHQQQRERPLWNEAWQRLTTEAVLRMQDRIETRFALKWRDLFPGPRTLARAFPDRPGWRGRPRA
jgi:hypothetical protein